MPGTDASGLDGGRHRHGQFAPVLVAHDAAYPASTRCRATTGWTPTASSPPGPRGTASAALRLVIEALQAGS